MRPRASCVFVILSILMATNVASAQFVSWQNTSGDSSWNNPQNWSNGQVPTSGSQLVFDDSGLSSGGLVDLGGSVQAASYIEFAERSNPSFYTLTDGVLKANRIDENSHFQIPSNGPDVISANVTTGTSSLQLGNSLQSLIVSGVIGGNGGAGVNNFSLYVGATLTAANTYSGSTIVNGTLTFAGASGSAVNSTSLDVENGTLAFDNSSAVNTNRVNSSAPITSRFATISFIGNASTPASETFGPLALTGGSNQFSVASNGAAARETFQSLTRTDGSTLDLSVGANGRVLLNSPSTAILVGGGGAAGSQNISILPYAAAFFPQGVSFVTYDSGPDGILGTTDDVGFRALNLATEYASQITSGTVSSANFRVTSPQTVSSSTTVNALIVSGSTISISPGAQLTISSGALALDDGGTQSTAAINGATLNFGSQEGILQIGSPAASPGSVPERHVISALVSGSAGLTKTGPGTLVLASANNFTGGLRINQGEVVSTVPGALSSGPVTLSGPGAQLGFESQSQSVPNNFVLDNSFNFTPVGQGAFSNTVSVDTGLNITISGTISGSGPLTKMGAGTLRLTGTCSVDIGASEGALYVNTTAGRGGFLDVESGAVMGGTGVLHGMLTVWPGGTLAPGDPVGTLTVVSSNFTPEEGSLRFELDGPAGGQYSKLSLASTSGNGVAEISGTLALTLGYTPSLGDSFTIVENQTQWPLQGIFQGLPEGSEFPVGTDQFQITYKGGDGNDAVVTVIAVPEPAISLSMVAIVSLVRRRRR